MEEACDDIDQMFSDLLGEMDLLTQSLGVETLPPPPANASNDEFNFAVGFKDLNESLNTLEDTDLDALMADLVADISEVEKTAFQGQKEVSCDSRDQPAAVTQPPANIATYGHQSSLTNLAVTHAVDNLTPLPADIDFDLLPPPPPPPTPPPEPLTQEEQEAQAKADKIKLALEKLKEAKVKKLVVKVHMNDNSTKSLMVDERQAARDVLDNLFEKTHCDCNVDWCLYEVYPELQIERFFEDHENVIENLSNWTRDTENKILFLEKNEKYAVFKNPQNYYLANKGKNERKEMNEKSKEVLLEESFCGTSVIVPELEGALYLKEDGKKSWKRRYFLLRASGIYYVPKGKTKTSRDLACFIQFENVNVYYGIQYKAKYKAPTEHCFVLKVILIGWSSKVPPRLLIFFHYLHRVQSRVTTHPQIQKESQYIKYLCCEDRQALHQWVTGIRIAKYGKLLYDNYNRAVQKTGLASRLAKLGHTEATATVGTSSKVISQANGQVPQAITCTTTNSSETGKPAEILQVKKLEGTNDASQPPLPSTPQLRQHRKPGGLCPPPPPQRRSSAITTSLQPPISTERERMPSLMDSADIPPPPALTLPAPELEDLPLLPPPPPDFFEAPPDFIPPPPPSFAAVGGSPELSLPPPPPPPPPPSFSAPAPRPPIKKKPPPPPKRQEESTQQAGGEDFMSDLMRALQKKRGDT